MSAGLKGQWVAVYRGGGGFLPGIEATAFLPTAPTATDSKRGTGYYSVMLNALGDSYGFQDVLKVAPDRLTWSFDSFDKDVKLVEEIDMNDILNLNGADLAQTRVTLGFGLDGVMTLEIGDVATGRVLSRLGRSVPPNNLVSAYIDFAGYGDSSQAQFQSLSANVSFQCYQAVSDLWAETYPRETVVPILAVGEGSNTYQQLTVVTSYQVSAVVGVGTWA